MRSFKTVAATNLKPSAVTMGVPTMGIRLIPTSNLVAIPKPVITGARADITAVLAPAPA